MAYSVARVCYFILTTRQRIKYHTFGNKGTPIIFVTLNYRVGPLGFPQGIEAGQRKALNLGLSDQLTALKWVHKNIPNFGGDNSKVKKVPDDESPFQSTHTPRYVGDSIRRECWSWFNCYSSLRNRDRQVCSRGCKYTYWLFVFVSSNYYSISILDFAIWFNCTRFQT